MKESIGLPSHAIAIDFKGNFPPCNKRIFTVIKYQLDQTIENMYILTR